FPDTPASDWSGQPDRSGAPGVGLAQPLPCRPVRTGGRVRVARTVWRSLDTPARQLHTIGLRAVRRPQKRPATVTERARRGFVPAAEDLRHRLLVTDACRAAPHSRRSLLPATPGVRW